VKIRQHFWIFEFHKVSVASYCRWGKNLCSMYTNQLVKELWKSVHICQSY